MERFLAWFEQPAIREGDEPSTMGGVLRAAISHLWFVTIHPFDDGNGRIARAITEMALSRSERSSHRFYSMSRQIRAERDAYYAVLEQTQSATMDITVWLTWFLCALNRALVTAEEQLDSALRKAQFWRSLAEQPLNLRQREMLNRLLEGFEGKLTSAKWAKISKCSPDTALRDINDLVESGILVREPAGGRSTSYRLAGV
jgi:Fic family protein